MIFILISAICAVAVFRWLFKSDEELRARFNLVYKFKFQVEEKFGITLTYEEALLSFQVTLKTMRNSQENKVYLDERYLNAQGVVDKVCAEAEKNVYRKL